MEYVALNNGIRMPLVGLGTWNLRGVECVKAVCQALQMGYRLVDTAQMYGNEKEVGQGLKRSGVAREEIFVTTKMDRRSNSYEKAKRAIAESLSNLQVDYVDLFLLHEPYTQGPEMYRALEEVYRSGKVRVIGISNYDEKWYKRFLNQCEIVPAVNQLEAHVYFQKWDFQKNMQAQGTAMQAWSPLTQQINRITDHPILNEMARKHQKSVAQIALRFLVQRGISVIPKSTHEERLKENIEIFDFELTADDIAQIKKLDRNDTLFSWTKAF